MRKSWRTKRMERINARCSVAGKRSQEVQASRRLERAQTSYELARIIEIKLPDGSIAATWKVYATNCPVAPLSVDFDGKIHRFMSLRRLSPLISRKLFSVAKRG